MDTDAAFEEIRSLISAGNTPAAVGRVRELASSDADPMVRIKCLSLLRAIDETQVFKTIVRDIMDSLPEDGQALIQIAGSLRGLDCPSSALAILRGLEPDDTVRRLSCMCLEDLDEYELALEAVRSIREPTPFDRVMTSEVLSALGEHAESVANAASLLDDMPCDFDARRAYVSALMLAGREKEAVRFTRGCLKEKTAESNALAAYVMRVTGNEKAAAGYATRAIKMDQGNVSAMETLGICLAGRGEYDKARIVAGAINEVSPGSRAALNVISYCEGHRPRPLRRAPSAVPHRALLALRLARLLSQISFQNPGVNMMTAVIISRRPIHISAIIRHSIPRSRSR